MKNRQAGAGWLVVGMALLVTLLSGCGSAPRPPRAITLDGVVVDGVRVARADETGLVRIDRDGAWIEARVPTVLHPGDWVTTGPNAQALIRYPSGSEVFMRPNTRGRVGSFSELVGEVFAKIRGAFAVQTSFVRAGAEGTAYSVRATPSGEYAVVVFDGTVRLSSLTDAWPAVALPAGTMGAGRPRVPPRPGPAPADELARTRGWVEQMERLLPPPPRSSGVGPALAVAALVAIIAASSSGSSDLAAPSGLAPAGATAQQPARPRSCSALALSWRPVDGARDYVVTVEPVAPAARATAPSAAPGATHTSRTERLVLPGSLGGLYRWRVQARAGSKTSPDSTPAYFYCAG